MEEDLLISTTATTATTTTTTKGSSFCDLPNAAAAAASAAQVNAFAGLGNPAQAAVRGVQGEGVMAGAPAVAALSLLATSRNKQETDGSRHSTAPPGTGCAKLSLWLRFSESLSNSAAIKTKKTAQSKRRNESYGRLKKGSRFLHWSQGKHGPDQSHKSPDFAVSKWRFQWECPTSDFFCYSGCGPI